MAVSLHNYYFPKLNGIPEESANTFWLRLVTPVWRLIPRVSLPIKVTPAPDPIASGDNKITGIGDLNIFATFVVTPDDSPAMFGIGPIYTAPTASDDALGNGKHEIGVAVLTVWTKGVILVGGLVNYQIGVGGDSNRPRTQFIAAQPFFMLQLGSGYYLRSAPIWFFDIEQPTYNVPFGLGAGKVLITEKVVFNLFIEPQFAVALRGIGSAGRPDLRRYEHAVQGRTEEEEGRSSGASREPAQSRAILPVPDAIGWRDYSSPRRCVLRILTGPLSARSTRRSRW